MPQTFNSLLDDMRACQLCQGLPLGPKPIFKLHANARILIVGQAPGRLAHDRGLPFDDPSGERLRIWLGVDRATFYDNPKLGIFPMGLCFPGTGTGGDLAPRPECAPAWRRQVLDHLPDIALTLVLGRYAIDWHLPHLRKKPVTEAVRQAAQDPAPVFVLPHPSPRNNRWLKKNPWFERDIVPEIQARTRRLLAAS